MCDHTPKQIPLVNQSTCYLLGQPIRPPIPFVYRPSPVVNGSVSQANYLARACKVALFSVYAGDLRPSWATF
jgi:hypothetical protein